MTFDIFIDGAVGTTGLEIRQRLQHRRDLNLIILDDAERRDAARRAAALDAADVAILCLPDDAARAAVAMIDNSRTRVIDASSAHRTAPGWTYGFPEISAEQPAAIARATRVSNPGCYPTGFVALIRPLTRAGALAPDAPISVHAVSGYSGGGKTMIAEFEQGGSGARSYALSLAHKHAPEMAHHGGLSATPLFSPMVVDRYRGMIVEVPLELSRLGRGTDLSAVEGLLRAAYQDAVLVRVADGEVSTVSIEDDAGTDRMTLRVCGNAALGQARLIATLDNLGKGAAGAAIQNLNIMLGCDEMEGLVP